MYFEQFSTAQKMRELAKTFYSTKACMYHYLNMAQGNYRDHLKGESVWVKKYFYVLRPILAINWLEQDLGIVPTEFQTLVEGVLEDRQLISDIHDLLELKRQGAELDMGPRVASISDYLDSEINRLSSQKFATYVHKVDMEVLNEFFRDTLSEVWS